MSKVSLHTESSHYPGVLPAGENKKPMRRELVLFTESFPYSSGETFIEAELPFLVRCFDKVVIVPRRNRSTSPPRPLPDRVVVTSPVLGADRFSMARLIRGCFNRATLAPFWSDLRGERPWLGLHRFLRWLGACLLIRIYLSQPRVREMLRASQGRVFYFYWGVNAAWLVPFVSSSVTAVARFHSIDLYRNREENRDYIPFQGLLLRKLHAALVVSNHGKVYLQERFPNLQGRITLHRLGVPEGSVSTRSDDGTFRVLSCSTLLPVKRVSLLIAALRQVRIQIQWIHIGDGPLRPELEIACQKLPKNVHWHFAGHIDNAAVREFYARNPVDLFVNVSRMEGVPVAVMEALSAGVPVAATAVGGTPELIDDSVGELLDADLSAQALADIIVGFARLRPQQTREKREAARRRAQALCLARRNFERTAAFIAGLAEPS